MYRLIVILIVILSISCIRSGKNEGFVEKGKFINGMRSGVWIKLNEDGQKISETTYVQGRKDGPSKSWNDQGQLYIIANYRNDKLIGKYIMFYPNGKKNFKQYYNEQGKTDGEFKLWFKSGVLSQEGKYNNGKMVGAWKEYFPSGQLKNFNYYNLKGQRDSIWYYINENEDTVNIKQYKDGTLIRNEQYK